MLRTYAQIQPILAVNYYRCQKEMKEIKRLRTIRGFKNVYLHYYLSETKKVLFRPFITRADLDIKIDVWREF